MLEISRRGAAFGKVSERAEWAHSVILEANQALRDAAKPGITGSDLRRIELAIFEKSRAKSFNSNSWAWGR